MLVKRASLRPRARHNSRLVARAVGKPADYSRWVWPNLLSNTSFFEGLGTTSQAVVEDIVEEPARWNFLLSETTSFIVGKALPRYGKYPPLSDMEGSWTDCEEGEVRQEKEEDEEELEQGYRTADSVRVVRVPELLGGFDLPWQVMVEKQSIYKPEFEEGSSSQPGSMDTFKYCAALNEYETWTKHRLRLQLSPNIVKMFGMHKSKTHISLFSEYCSGGDVQTLLGSHVAKLALGGPALGALSAESGGMTEEEVCEIARDVLHGLDAMHQGGLIYG
eukprot:gene30894-35943_t